MNEEEKKLLAACTLQSYKASGKGGQHVQKTDSAVRLIHKPTGIRVSSQQERSQYLNKLICIRRLKKKLEEKSRIKKRRIPTKKSKRVKEEILKGKKHHSQKKQLRGKINDT